MLFHPLVSRYNALESYDQCSEAAALATLLEEEGCTAPYLNSAACSPICEGTAQASQVTDRIWSLVGKQEELCPQPCRKMMVRGESK